MKNEDEIIDLMQDKAISLERERKLEQQMSSVSPIENNYSTTYNGNNINDNIEGFVFGDIASTNGMQSNYSNATDPTINNMDTQFTAMSRESVLDNTSMNGVAFMPGSESTVGSTISNTNAQFNTISEEPMKMYEGFGESVLDNVSMNKVASMPSDENTVESSISGTNLEFNAISEEPALNNISQTNVSFISNDENRIEPTINNMNTGFNLFGEIPIETYPNTEEISHNTVNLNVEQPLTSENDEVQSVGHTSEEAQENHMNTYKVPGNKQNSKTLSFKDDTMPHNTGGNITFMIVFALILLVITFLLPYISGYK